MSARNNSTTAQPAAEYVGVEVPVPIHNGSRHHCISQDDYVCNIEQGPEDVSLIRSEQGQHDVVDDIIYISNEIPRNTLADAPLINSDQVLVNATSTVDIFTPPPLPEDKVFHAMLCYESEDRQWARAIYTELESEPYSLKCCISDIHFLASMPILQNIEVNLNLYKQNYILLFVYQTIWISNNFYY